MKRFDLAHGRTDGLRPGQRAPTHADPMTLRRIGVLGSPVAAVAFVAFVAALSAGCTPPPAAPSALGSHASAELNTATPASLVAAVAAAGLPAPHPHDVTAQACAGKTCVAAEQTDTITILKFSASNAAQNYDSTHHDTYQIEDIVVAFAPTVDDGTRAAYERAVTRAVN